MICNEDCFDRIKKIENKAVSLVLSDPPYGISFQNNEWDNMSNDSYSELIRKYLTECKRILTDEGSIILFFAPSMTDYFLEAVNKADLYPHFDFWKSICRQKGRGAKNKLKSQREDFMLITKKKDNFVCNSTDDLFSYKENTTNILNYYTGEVERPEFKLNDTIYDFKMPYYLSTTEKQIHSCQKSVLLLYALIKNFSNEKDLVFDGFMGSGSCAIAAKLADRDFIGCETDINMFIEASRWINDFNYAEYKKNFLKNGKWFGVL